MTSEALRAATVVHVLQDFEAPPTIALRLPTTVANPHRSLASKETHIQSHNRQSLPGVIGALRCLSLR